MGCQQLVADWEKQSELLPVGLAADTSFNERICLCSLTRRKFEIALTSKATRNCMNLYPVIELDNANICELQKASNWGHLQPL